MGWDRRAVGRAALACAAVFVAVAAGQLGGWWNGPNNAVDAVVADGLHHEVDLQARCEDAHCSYVDEVGGYESSTPRNGTWNETRTSERSWLPWAGQLLRLGEPEAALAVAMLAVVLLLLLGDWRGALVAGATAAVGGALVNPLKYGGRWAPYPSGHTIGATLTWGLLLLFLVAALRRAGARLPPRTERNALLAWGLVALAVGSDLVHSGYHVASDVVLGWAYSGALALGACGWARPGTAGRRRGVRIEPTRRQLAVAAIAFAAAYFLFSLAVALHLFDTLDLRVNAWTLRHVGDDFLGVPWYTWTSVGSGALSTVAAALAAFLAWRAGAGRTAAVILAVALAGGVLVGGLKDLHGRPYPGGPGVFVVVPEGTNATACPEGAHCSVALRGNATVYCPPGSRCEFHEENATAVAPDPTVFPDRPGRAYPSGHTIGATVSWGAALLLGTRAVQRRRSFDPWAVAAWAAVAVVGGVSRVPVHAHWASDVVGAWLLGLCLLAAAVLADDRWRELSGDGGSRAP